MSKDLHQLLWLSEAKLDVIVRIIDDVLKFLGNVEVSLKLFCRSLFDGSLSGLLLLLATPGPHALIFQVF